MSRTETTAMLSKLVEKRLKNRVSYWASEVNFDLGTPRNRRIDYIGFKPFTPGYVLEPSSVELGTFSCYEIKSCMADFKSGHGLTFYGDENYLVTTPELADDLLDEANAYERGMDDDLTLAKRLCWDSYEWDGVDSDCVAKDEDDAWDYAGEICGYQEDFIDRARDLLEVARKAVNE